MRRILILGKIPPPVGGVTIHVLRLQQALTNRGFHDYDFLDLGKTSYTVLVREVLSHPVIHLHTSNAYFQMLIAFLCLFSKKKLIITYHGNLGRYNAMKNMMVLFTCRICYIPIVLNEESLAIAMRHNSRTIKISSYIAPHQNNPVDAEIGLTLSQYQQQFEYIFCTNASNLSWDKNGQEIYGISQLVQKFTTIPEALLIISDPSQKYWQHIQASRTIPPNVQFFFQDHIFAGILHHSHAFIRNTTTDGDSISIHEALNAGLVVFASNVVPRPPECLVYENVFDLDLVKSLHSQKNRQRIPAMTTQSTTKSIEDILKLYYKCLN